MEKSKWVGALREGNEAARGWEANEQAAVAIQVQEDSDLSQGRGREAEKSGWIPGIFKKQHGQDLVIYWLEQVSGRL